MLDLSIIILNFNTKDITLECLQKLYSSDMGSYQAEVMVVDNASTDDSLEHIRRHLPELTNPHIKPLVTIKNPQNLGFAAGNNVGIKKAKGNYILLLNSDVMLESLTLQKQLLFMQANTIYTISTCKLLIPSSTNQVFKLDKACHRGEPTLWNSFCYFIGLEFLLGKNKLFGGYHQSWKPLDRAHRVDVISGAFFLCPKTLFDTIGLLDERFFMYAEDIDLCMRASSAGYKIGFNPHVTALHLKGQSGRKKTSQSQASYHFWETMKIFYQKHYHDKYPKWLTYLVFKLLDLKKS